MANLSFAIAGPTLDLSVVMQIADTDARRIMAYLMASSYGKVTENVVTQQPDPGWSPGEGETEADRPTIPVQSWVTRDATPEETAQHYAGAVLNALLVETVNYEKAQAAAAAAAGVSAINPV